LESTKRTSDLYAAIEKQRSWAPGCDLELIFRNWTTTAAGRRLYAQDYRHGACPLLVRRRRQATSPNYPEHFEPIPSSRRLPGGFRAGDRVQQRYWGTGRIVSIEDKTTVIDFDRWGPKAFGTLRAHYYLTKAKT
jgi:hypothetical protein